MDTISVRNESGQVTHFAVTGPEDPRAKILNQRIARGDLEKVSKSTKTADVTVVVFDDHAGVRDEKGDLLKSVHGGGLDPDADGDALGQPSGSKVPEGAEDPAAGDDQVDDEAVPASKARGTRRQ